MFDSVTNYFWQHPVGVIAGAVAAIVILIWMTGSGSRQRFIVLKRTKETEGLARDINRIANALEKIAKHQEMPVDYVGRPMGPGWEDPFRPAESSAGTEEREDAGLIPASFSESNGKNDSRASSPAAQKEASEGAKPQSQTSEPARIGGTKFRSFTDMNPEPSTPAPIPDPRRSKKTLDLPNPLYRPK